MQRYALLVAIKSLEPRSIYDLAKQVNRDITTVQRDCNALSGAGFIELIDAGDERKSKRPRLVFDYREIMVHSPIAAHSLSLPKAA